MMKKKIYCSILLSFLFVGCGGGGSSATAEATTPTQSQELSTSTSDQTESLATSQTQESTASSSEQTETTAEEVVETSDNTTISLQDIMANPQPYEAPLIDEADKQAYLDAINNARAQEQTCNGVAIGPVSALEWNDTLYRAAYEHTYDLVQSDTFDHNGSNTSSDWTSNVQSLGRGSEAHERIANNGYNLYIVGENITAGFEDKDPNKPKNTAEMAVASWLASESGHCENLMNPDYTEVGMAYIMKEGTTYVHYWTQNLGKPQ